MAPSSRQPASDHVLTHRPGGMVVYVLAHGGIDLLVDQPCVLCPSIAEDSLLNFPGGGVVDTVRRELPRRTAQRHSLGIAVLMRYAWLKYNEVMNLRMISRGLAVHLPKSRIEEEVLHV